MKFQLSVTRRCLFSSLLLVSFVTPAFGLVRWNENKDQVHIRASASWMYDSNIYVSAGAVEDNIIMGTLGAEYRRQAGLIGINADIAVMISDFSENVDESFTNPNMRVELTKDTGRTTGTLGFTGFRESRADPAANLRTDSWNYGSELRMKYPINQRHSIAGGLDWKRIDYLNNDFLVDLDMTSLAADWFYVFTPERDLFAGYRLRLSETSVLDRYADHSISGGIAGRLIRGLNGTARVGFQNRYDLGDTGNDNSGWNASISATWNFSRTVALTAGLNKDLNITSTNISTDVLSGNLDLQYARSAKLVFSTGVGAGVTNFLGIAGDNREDTYFSAYARAQYTFSEKLSIGATYSYFRNWSTQSFSDFTRDSITFDASSRF